MGLFQKINKGLKKTRESMSAAIDNMLYGKVEIDDTFFDDLEEVLVMGDVGVTTAEQIVTELRERAQKENLRTADKVKRAIREIVARMLSGGEEMSLITMPSIILVIGVNGVGKTTSIGKLTKYLADAGASVLLAAADTFRAAAVEQLCIWGERVGVPVIKQQQGSDPASVAYDTLQSAKANDADVVLIDTAGRLHNKINLMNELTKIKNVMQKVVPDAPHDVMLVLDGSTGQNAFEQARQFTAATQVSSLAITKLDGTAKGGVVIGISDQFKIPVRYIGLGEQMTDLQVFNRVEFVRSLLGNIN